MKYFTEEWCFGEIDNDEAEETLKKYKQYISSVFPKMPFVLKLLAKSINLHDGFIEKIEHFSQNLILSGIFGDLDSGYFKLKITYRNVTGFELTKSSEIFSNKVAEIIRDEIEVMDNKSFVHRFLLSNKAAYQIHFSDCGIEIETAKKTDYRKINCTFISK
jgi:hypothetical protein